MPLAHKTHRDVPLENVSVAYKSKGAIAGNLPVVPVVRQSDIYYVYSKDVMTIPRTIRQRGRANRADWDVSTSSYLLENHALEGIVYDRDRRNADKPMNLDVDTTEILTDKINLRYEKSAATLFQLDTNWSNNLSLTSTMAFNTTGTNPILIFDTATSVIAQQSGNRANTVIVNLPTFFALKENTSTVDRIKFTSADSISEAMLAKLLNVERFWVASAIENTGQEQLADATTTSQQFIWTNAAWIGFLETSPGLKKASAVYTFQLNMGTDGTKVDRWREEGEEADMIRVQREYQIKAVATSSGFLIEGVVV